MTDRKAALELVAEEAGKALKNFPLSGGFALLPVKFALAALDAAPPEDDGWRPIETAPRDGTTHIIVPGGTAVWSPAASAWFSDQAQAFIQWPVQVWQPLPPPPRKPEDAI